MPCSNGPGGTSSATGSPARRRAGARGRSATRRSTAPCATSASAVRVSCLSRRTVRVVWRWRSSVTCSPRRRPDDRLRSGGQREHRRLRTDGPRSRTRAEAAGAWLHVDGAFGLWAGASPAFRHLVPASTAPTPGPRTPISGSMSRTTRGSRSAVTRRASRSDVRSRDYLDTTTSARRDQLDWTPESRAGREASPSRQRSAARTQRGRRARRALVRCGCAVRRAAAAADGVEVLNDVVLNQVLVPVRRRRREDARGRAPHPGGRDGVDERHPLARPGGDADLRLELETGPKPRSSGSWRRSCASPCEGQSCPEPEDLSVVGTGRPCSFHPGRPRRSGRGRPDGAVPAAATRTSVFSTQPPIVDRARDRFAFRSPELVAGGRPAEVTGWRSSTCSTGSGGSSGVYADVRRDADPERAWRRWRDVRDDLFAHHPQSPVCRGSGGGGFGGLTYFDYDASFRVLGDVSPVPHEPQPIVTSGEKPFSFHALRTLCSFELTGEPHELNLYWLDGYGGGAFLRLRSTRRAVPGDVRRGAPSPRHGEGKSTSG